MPGRPEPAFLPSITLRGYGDSIWLEGRAVLLEQNGTRRRIPITAIEGARAVGAGQRSVEIALWGTDGAPGPVFVVEGRHADQAERLVEVINRARPQSAPPGGGAGLVEVLPDSSVPGRKRMSPRERVAALTALIVYIGGAASLALFGEPVQVMMWVLGVMPVLLGLIISGPAVVNARDRLVLRKRGVAVVALLDRDHGKRRFFKYTDLDGAVHEIQADYAARGLGGDPQRINVVYDPHHPEKAVCTLERSTLVFRTVGVGLLGGLLLSVGFLMMPFQLVLLALS
ncbi:hypothetical protein BN159_1302 [Streptomyces davaonensis JCM 4913]|uniref:DUF3592 domain-containing protein n=1 Tax=Streptomyces davaonensis (strain DSM 101723 / JCM 4913 / KCC S-0913 / 768) TaxID=1214101 RepID=K4QT29_STRDJ|nr:hypothetical protein [Streptomyces davaonensis]CCK25681.1 hypothetical protein BN159_1302 [Streptomyces davaonensis JCM 4913]